MFFIEQDTTDCWFLYMSTSWNILLYSRKYFLCFFCCTSKCSFNTSKYDWQAKL